MKKILFTIFLLTFPTSIKAQDNLEPTKIQVFQTYQRMVYQRAKQFFPIACKEKLPKAIEAVKQCYATTSDSHPTILFCLILDNYVIRMAKYNDKLTEMYPKNIINFINDYPKRLKLHSAITINYKNDLDNLNKLITRASISFSKKINDLYFDADLEKKHCIDNEFSENGFLDQYKESFSPSDFFN